jgi:predicted DNA-binding transcriptional regulator AlpA
MPAGYLKSKHVQERYCVSAMSLWRWLHDDKLRFPKPMYIGKRRYWKITELEEWERARARRAS